MPPPETRKKLGTPMTGAAIKRPPIHRIAVTQLVVLVLVGLTLSMLDQVKAYSLLSGGLIAIVPQAYFAARVFRLTGAKSAKAIARASYSGEIGKFVLTAAGFAVVFAAISPIDGLSVFIGYLIMLAIQITGSWLLLR
jgi:ATP synthase protein I